MRITDTSIVFPGRGIYAIFVGYYPRTLTEGITARMYLGVQYTNRPPSQKWHRSNVSIVARVGIYRARKFLFVLFFKSRVRPREATDTARPFWVGTAVTEAGFR